MQSAITARAFLSALNRPATCEDRNGQGNLRSRIAVLIKEDKMEVTQGDNRLPVLAAEIRSP
jgi:hypothetical protein